MKVIRDSNNIVTCEYCQYYRKKQIDNKIDIFESNWSICEKKNTRRHCDMEICEDFVIMEGYYTTKSFPKK